MDGISTEYKNIAIDLPNHGKSDGFSDISKINLDLFIELIEELKNFLNLEKLVLAGHSLGGAIILSYYFKNPDDVEALILCSTGARLRVSPVIFQHLKEGTKQYLNYIRQLNFYRKTPKSIIDTYRKQVSKIDPPVIYNDYKICDSFDRMKEMDLINIPCLILCGEEDILTPVKYSQYFHDNIKNSQLYIVKEARHMVQVEKPEEVNQYIQQFIETL